MTLTVCDRRIAAGLTRRPHRLPVLIERRHQHALRSADGADGLQLALADAVVDRAPRNVEERGGLIDRDASPELLFEHLLTFLFLVKA